MRMRILISISLITLFCGTVNLSVSYSQLQLHTRPGHVDLWTLSETGCTCPGHDERRCPCCAAGGCPCHGSRRCVQCGLERACSNGEVHSMILPGYQNSDSASSSKFHHLALLALLMVLVSHSISFHH